jgi:hypothetical protein
MRPIGAGKRTEKKQPKGGAHGVIIVFQKMRRSCGEPRLMGVLGQSDRYYKVPGAYSARS